MSYDRYGNLLAESPGTRERTAMAPVNMNEYPVGNAAGLGLSPPLLVTAVPGGVLTLDKHSSVQMNVPGVAYVVRIDVPRTSVALLAIENLNADPLILKHTGVLQILGGADRVLPQGAASFLLQVEQGVWHEIAPTGGSPGDPGTVVTGSDANGTWIDFTDGRREARAVIDDTTAAWSTPSGSLFVRGSSLTWVYPGGNMIAPPDVTVTVHRGDQVAMGARPRIPGTGSVLLVPWTAIALAADTIKSIAVRAYGRWRP